MTDPTSDNLPDIPSPSSYMRQRRPEQFLDAPVPARPTLDRTVFEYHLDTLTSRGEEKKFEYFARKLAERRICPNLIPQTGPTGGGDSKVDTETYPVHEDIAERWYEGPSTAAQERWAFAVSAKQKWQPKVRSDIKSIASTNRGYSRACFITNQFVPDKKRAETEDKLSEEFGIPLRILDRSWIMESVFEHDCTDIAIQTFSLQPEKTSSPTYGPSDQQKQDNLDAYERDIADSERYRGVEFQLVEDCLSAAIISRELQKPRYETDGRFQRALSLAQKYGTERQAFHVIYQQAWTANFWYDDFDTLLALYNQVETFALSSKNTEDVERCLNLWQCFFSAVIKGERSGEDIKLSQKASRLDHHLSEIAADTSRPNNAANAHGQRLLLLIEMNFGNTDRQRELLTEIGTLISTSQHLGDFSFDRSVDILEVLEGPLGEYPSLTSSRRLYFPS